jgi:uncharacterized DUF497 family protein
VEFEWDYSKEAYNIQKHGITFLEAAESFSDPKGILFRDDKHSSQEVRLYWIGKTRAGKVLTTRFTRRGAKIRIIGSAVWRKFRRMYETAKVK